MSAFSPASSSNLTGRGGEFSCRTLPHIPFAIAGIEPEPSSAFLCLNPRKLSAQTSRKLSAPGPRPHTSPSRRHGGRAHSTPSCWASAVLSVAHNALRSECAHLRTIIASLRHRGHSRVQNHEVDELASWWTVFSNFAEVVLDTEQRIIIPWALARGGEKLRDELDDARAAALDAIAAVEATLDLRRHVDRNDVLGVFLADAPVASCRLLEYCSALHSALVPLIRANRAPAEKSAVDRKVLSALKRGQDGGVRIAILVEWMQPAVRDKWVRSNMRPVNRLLYPRWAKRYYRDHVVVPMAFQRRLDALRGLQRESIPLSKKGIHSPPVTPEKKRPLFANLRSDLDAYASSNTSPESRGEDGVPRVLDL